MVLAPVDVDPVLLKELAVGAVGEVQDITTTHVQQSFQVAFFDVSQGAHAATFVVILVYNSKSFSRRSVSFLKRLPR